MDFRFAEYKVYSPQLGDTFTVIEEKGNALICREGVTLSKKLVQEIDNIYDGSKIADNYEDELVYHTISLNKPLFAKPYLGGDFSKCVNIAKDFYNNVPSDELFRTDLNYVVNQNFYD